MIVRPAASSLCKLESLEARQLLATINVTDHGAVPDDGQDDWAAIAETLLRHVRPGDTLAFAPGVYNVSKTLTFRTGQTISGNNEATLKFDGLGSRIYGATFFKDSTDIVVQGLKFDGGGLSLAHGSKYTNIKIINNEITRTSGTAGVYGSIPSEGLIVEGNKIHNFNHWGVILWHMNNGSYSHNKLCNIQQGAHILAPRDNNRVSFNVGRHITRMGIEMQAHGNSIARNTTVEGNVFYDWKLPYRDSFGLSIVPDRSINTKILNNYISGNHTGDWNPEAYTDGQGQRYGYGIEAGFDSGEVTGNIIGGPFANHIVVSHPNMLVKNNKMFGVPKWRNYIAPEGGPHGMGSWIDGGGNTQNRNFGAMPAHGAPDPCAGLPGGGGSGPNPNPNPDPDPGPGGRIAPPTNLAARPISSSQVDLSWKDNSNNEVGFKIERSYFAATGPWTQVGIVTSGVTKWINFGLPANKTIWYRVRAYGAVGNSDYSNVVQVKTPPLGGTVPGGGTSGGGFTTNSAGATFTGGSGFATNTSDDTSPFSELLI